MKQQKRGLHAVIMAQGGRIQLRPLTDHLPTALLPVGGTPLLDHQIQMLKKLGVTQITVVGGYRAAQLEQACRFYPEVTFQNTGESLRRPPVAAGLLHAGLTAQGPLLVLRGDLLPDPTALQVVLSDKEDACWVDSSGCPQGMAYLSQETAEILLESLSEATDQEPISWIHQTLEDEVDLPSVPSGDTTLVTSMEALAVALRRTPSVAAASPEPTPAPSPAMESEREPAREADQPAVPLFPQPLYKTLPH